MVFWKRGLMLVLVISFLIGFSDDVDSGPLACECWEDADCVNLGYDPWYECEVQDGCSGGRDPPGACVDPYGGEPPGDMCECIAGPYRGLGYPFECGTGFYCQEGYGECEPNPPLQDGMCVGCPNSPICPADEKPDNLVCCGNAGLEDIEFGVCQDPNPETDSLWRGEPYQWCFGGCEYSWSLEDICSGNTPYCYNSGCQAEPPGGDTHKECRNRQCTIVNGPGTNECFGNLNCWDCTISNVRISDNCGVDGCEYLDTITITADYSGVDCPLGKHLQVNAAGGDCSLEYAGRDISGVYNTVLGNLEFIDGTVTGLWRVDRDPTSTDCSGETVSATQARLHLGRPGGSVISNLAPASGSFNFIGESEFEACSDYAGWVTKDVEHKGPQEMECTDVLIGCVRDSDSDDLYDEYCSSEGVKDIEVERGL